MNRILDLSEESAELCVRLENFVIRREGRDDIRIPISEVAAIIVSHPRVRYTHAVLSKLAAAGGVFVTCDERRLPVGMMLPLQGHFTQAERMAAQIAASLPMRKRLWKQIVRAKILAQAALLKQVRGDDAGLTHLARRVRSGDVENIEARAAQRYWPRLFSDPAFVRDPNGGGANALLNYGYAVLRAMVARAVCAVGLHPAVGIHHHNRYNPLPLVDDLMEPFRPIVDRAVVSLIAQRGDAGPLDREAKAALIEALTGRFDLNGEQRTLFDIVQRVASSLVAVFTRERSCLILPDPQALIAGQDLSHRND